MKRIDRSSANSPIERDLSCFVDRLFSMARRPWEQLPIDLRVSCSSINGPTDTRYRISVHYLNGVPAFNDNCYVKQEHDDEDKLNPEEVKRLFIGEVSRRLKSKKPSIRSESGDSYLKVYHCS